MNKKLQYGSLLLLAIYTLFFLFLKFFFFSSDSYATQGLGTRSLILAILCLVNFGLLFIFIRKKKEPNKAINLACWLNFLPIVLILLFMFAESAGLLSAWRNVSSHWPIVPLWIISVLSIGSFVFSFILFSIGSYKSTKI
jgi:amino acid transporter